MKTGDAEYTTIHVRIFRERGSAKEWICDCGRQARDWSWDHVSDPHDIWKYVARCRFCHMQFDMTDEWKKNAVEGRLGYRHSEETKRKISEARRKH